jgi:DNA-binding XRE family transcriptional regulator
LFLENLLKVDFILLDMSRKISDQTKNLIENLYAQDLPVAEIARRANVSYPTAYGYTRLKQRINPETRKPFESLGQLMDYQARQRINRAENQGLSDLIKRRLKELGKNQSWLARELGITRQAVSFYVKGRSIPSDDLLERLYSTIEIPYQTLNEIVKTLSDNSHIKTT